MSDDLVGATFPSARACLEQRIGCRAMFSAPWQWRLYWSEGGYELTLYQPDEGPQEMGGVDEAIEMIGGDQPVRLNPGTIKYLNNLSEIERARILDAISQPTPCREVVASVHMGRYVVQQVTNGGEFWLELVEPVQRIDFGDAKDLVAALSRAMEG